MNEILKEFYEAVSYLKGKGWEILFFIDCKTTGQPIVPFISVKISENMSLRTVLNDTYYIDIMYKSEKWAETIRVRDNVVVTIEDQTILGQVTYSPEGNLTTSEETLTKFRNEMTEREGELYIKFVEDLYYFFKPNSVNFIKED